MLGKKNGCVEGESNPYLLRTNDYIINLWKAEILAIVLSTLALTFHRMRIHIHFSLCSVLGWVTVSSGQGMVELHLRVEGAARVVHLARPCETLAQEWKQLLTGRGGSSAPLSTDARCDVGTAFFASWLAP